MATTNNHDNFSIQLLNPDQKDEMLVIRNCRILYKNFSGTKTQYNRAGDRNFDVVIDDYDTALDLNEHGWNVRIKDPREEGEDPLCHLKINVRYDGRSPALVWMVKNRKKTLLTEANVGVLDMSRIIKADVCARPYHYDSSNGGRRISAYLKEVYVHVEAGIFDDEYANYETDTSSLNTGEDDGSLPF